MPDGVEGCGVEGVGESDVECCRERIGGGFFDEEWVGFLEEFNVPLVGLFAGPESDGCYPIGFAEEVADFGAFFAGAVFVFGGNVVGELDHDFYAVEVDVFSAFGHGGDEEAGGE